MDYKNTWQFFAIGSAFFAAFTAVFSKLGVTDMNSNVATFIRTILICFLLGCVIWWRRDWQTNLNISLKNWGFLTASAIATGLSWLCYFRALQLGPVSRVAPVDKLSVVFVILFSVIFLSEKLTWATLIGGGFIIVGSLVMTLF